MFTRFLLTARTKKKKGTKKKEQKKKIKLRQECTKPWKLDVVNTMTSLIRIGDVSLGPSALAILSRVISDMSKYDG